MCEKFNQHRLNYVIEHFDEICKEQNFMKDNREKTLMSLKRYLRESTNGTKYIKYYYSNDEIGGRFQSKGMSLCRMPNYIRSYVMAGLYNDYDLQMSGISITRAMLDHCEECQYDGDTIYIDEYMDKREEKLKDTGLPRNEAKTLFTIILNGGDHTNIVRNIKNSKSRNFVNHFATEMIEIREHICTNVHNESKYNEFKGKLEKANETENFTGKFLARLVYNKESEVIHMLHDITKGAEYSVYTYDGIMLPKDYKLHEFGEFTEDDIALGVPLDRISEFISERCETKITLVQKPIIISDVLRSRVPDVVPEYEDISYKWFGDFKNMRTVNFSTISKGIFKKWARKNVMFISDGGDLKILTRNKEINQNTSLASAEYKTVNIKSFERTMAVKVAFTKENEKFDKDLYLKIKNNPAYIIPDEEQEKIKKGEISIKFKSHTFTTLLNNMYANGEAKIYDKTTFKPHLRRDSHRINNIDQYNTFSYFDFDTDKITSDIDFTESRWYNHMKKYMCSNNEDEFEHFMDWMAHAIQDPLSDERPSAQVFISEQGNGKGTIIEWVRKMLGHQHYTTINDMDAFLRSRFNAEHAGKLFKFFEEVRGSRNIMSNADILKAIIKETTERKEQKMIDPLFIRAVSRFILFSQHMRIVYVEAGDRRFDVHKCDNTWANKKEYWNLIYKELSDPKFIKASFDFLANRVYDKSSVLGVCENEFREELMIKSLPSAFEFLKEYIEDKYFADDIPHFGEDHKHWRVPVSKLQRKYVGYGNGNNAKTLITQLENAKIKPSTGRLVHPKKVPASKAHCFNLYPPLIEETMAKYLKIKSFRLNLFKNPRDKRNNDFTDEQPEQPNESSKPNEGGGDPSNSQEEGTDNLDNIDNVDLPIDTDVDTDVASNILLDDLDEFDGLSDFDE